MNGPLSGDGGGLGGGLGGGGNPNALTSSQSHAVAAQVLSAVLDDLDNVAAKVGHKMDVSLMRKHAGSQY